MAIQKDIDICSGFTCNYLKITNIVRDIQKQTGGITLLLFKDKDNSLAGAYSPRSFSFTFTSEDMPFLLGNFQSKYNAGVPLDKIVLAIAYDFIKNKIDNDPYDVEFGLYGDYKDLKGYQTVL